ncbi:MAG: hypothetical protein KJ757_05005, partial [Planctomycetes bacterium]|nr:hypothetical protein [Planctomycetota bacterium]
MSHEHHHHGIGKHEADEPLNFSGGLDAGSKSLADALRISFAVLKIIMVVLVILFFSSGVFTVAPDERAMVLRFGRIRGDTTEKRILGPGLHWAIPYPIEEVIKLPARNTVLRTAIDSFWYNERNKLPPASLDPIIEGYSITRNDTIADLKG